MKIKNFVRKNYKKLITLGLGVTIVSLGIVYAVKSKNSISIKWFNTIKEVMEKGSELESQGEGVRYFLTCLKNGEERWGVCKK